MLNGLHKQLLNNYQQDFPLSPTPYKDIAESLGVTEEDVLFAFQQLNDQQFISRIGAVIAPNKMGCSALMAMAVPTEQLQQVASLVNKYPQVNHNYERENYFNLWFVLIAEDAEHLQTLISELKLKTGLETLYLPLLANYFINLGFELDFDD